MQLFYNSKHPFKSLLGTVALTCVFAVLGGCAKPDPAAEAARRAQQAVKQLEKIRAQSAQQGAEKTLQALEVLNEKYPEQPVVLEELGLAFGQTDKPGHAAFFFEEAARLDIQRTPLLLFAAEIYTEQNEWESVARVLQNYTQQNPQQSVALKKLAQAYARLNRPKPAVETYLEAVKTAGGKPTGSEAAEVGALFQSLGNRTQAQQWYNRALEDKEEPAAQQQARLGLLEIAIAQRDWTQAGRWVEQLDEKNPGELDKSHLASIRAELKQWQKARGELSAVTIKVSNADELLSAVQTQEVELLPADSLPPAQPQKPEEQEAVEAPAEAETPSAPEEPEAKEKQLSDAAKALVEQAQKAVEAGELSKAAGLYYQAIAQDETHGELWMRLAAVYLALGQKEQAELMALEGRRHDPDSADTARAYLKIVQSTRPGVYYLNELAVVREQFPKDNELLLMLIRSLQKNGNPQAAKLLCEEFLQRAGDSPEAPQVRELLQEL